MPRKELKNRSRHPVSPVQSISDRGAVCSTSHRLPWRMQYVYLTSSGQSIPMFTLHQRNSSFNAAAHWTPACSGHQMLFPGFWLVGLLLPPALQGDAGPRETCWRSRSARVVSANSAEGIRLVSQLNCRESQFSSQANLIWETAWPRTMGLSRQKIKFTPVFWGLTFNSFSWTPK